MAFFAWALCLLLGAPLSPRASPALSPRASTFQRKAGTRSRLTLVRRRASDAAGHQSAARGSGPDVGARGGGQPGRCAGVRSQRPRPLSCHLWGAPAWGGTAIRGADAPKGYLGGAPHSQPPQGPGWEREASCDRSPWATSSCTLGPLVAGGSPGTWDLTSWRAASGCKGRWFSGCGQRSL